MKIIADKLRREFGKTIAVIVRNFSAKVTCYESPRIAIRPLLREAVKAFEPWVTCYR